MPREYQSRSTDAWSKRASANSGDRKGFVKEECSIWRVKNGESRIRILPPEPDADHYGIDVWVHYQVGPDKASVLCLQKHKNQRCPLCEARVRAEKADAGEEALRELRPSQRVLFYLIDRNDEKSGPQLYPAPRTLDRDISIASRDRQTGEVSEVDNPEAGFDLSFLRDGEGRLTKYSGVQLSRKASPLHRDEGLSDEWRVFVEEHPLSSVLRWRNYDEVKRLYEGEPEDEEPAPLPRARAPGAEPAAPAQQHSRAVVNEDDDETPPFDVPGSAREEEPPRVSPASKWRERLLK